MSALRNLTAAELRAKVAEFEAERERTTPGVHQAEVDAYAMCRDCTCEGNITQRPVRAIRQTQVVTHGDLDGDKSGPFAGMISHTHTLLRFANPDDATCPVCQLSDSDLTLQVRPSYGMAFGGSDALLRVRKAEIAPPPDAATLIATVDAAKHRHETPHEALTARYVRSEIDDAEYARKLEVLGLPIPAALQDAVKPDKAA